MHKKLRSPKLGIQGNRVRFLGWIVLVNKSLRRGCITKILPWETRRVLQTKFLKVVPILLRGLGYILVVRSIWLDVVP